MSSAIFEGIYNIISLLYLREAGFFTAGAWDYLAVLLLLGSVPFFLVPCSRLVDYLDYLDYRTLKKYLPHAAN